MAKILARMPVIATRTVSGGTASYSAGVAVGKMIQAQINPTFNNAELYADDGVAERDSSFIEAAVTLGTSAIPVAALPLMFGITYTAEVTTQGSEAPATTSYGKDDVSPYVGFGFISGEVVDGTKSFKVTWLPKVKFVLPSETYQTKGKNAAFSTSSISGVAEGEEADTGNWKQEFEYDTAAEAVTKLKALAGISS